MTVLIGVDCAVDHKNIGIAVGQIRPRGVGIKQICVGQSDPAGFVAKLLADGAPAVLALDSPLGWPAGLHASLTGHLAGHPIQTEAHMMFRRETDRFVRRKTRKQPLEVGSDRIARTALASLKFLADVRTRSGLSIPLAWQPDEPANARCVEVYPAATLEAHAISSRGYKGKEGKHQQARSSILEALGPNIQMEQPLRNLAIQTDHALDAGLCVLAGADFLRGLAHQPEDLETAKKEGWIWVRAF